MTTTRVALAEAELKTAKAAQAAEERGQVKQQLAAVRG